jgi:Transglutaminase-like superfamily
MLRTKGLDAALAPPPPPPLPAEAERGLRGALQQWQESCLVNAIVLQAWEAAHGRRRDLVVGVTGPDAFSAHAWLEGDPVPTPDGAPPDGFSSPSGERRLAARDGSNRGEEAGGRDGDAPRTVFTQLLRRPAPEYSLDGSTWVR